MTAVEHRMLAIVGTAVAGELDLPGPGSVDPDASFVDLGLDSTGIVVVADRLGRWLRKVQGQIVNGLVLMPAGSHAGYQRWQVNTVKS